MSTAERLAYYTERGPDCWLFNGPHITRTGYGLVYDSAARKRRSAHRVAYEIYIGPVPTGLYVLHSCDVRDCVNPAHLRAGTQSDNMRDREKHGAGLSKGTPPPCSVNGCERASRNHATLLCDPHYRRTQRNGVPGPAMVRTGNYSNRWKHD